MRTWQRFWIIQFVTYLFRDIRTDGCTRAVRRKRIPAHLCANWWTRTLTTWIILFRYDCSKEKGKYITSIWSGLLLLSVAEEEFVTSYTHTCARTHGPGRWWRGLFNSGMSEQSKKNMSIWKNIFLLRIAEEKWNHFTYSWFFSFLHWYLNTWIKERHIDEFHEWHDSSICHELIHLPWLITCPCIWVSHGSWRSYFTWMRCCTYMSRCILVRHGTLTILYMRWMYLYVRTHLKTHTHAHIYI